MNKQMRELKRTLEREGIRVADVIVTRGTHQQLVLVKGDVSIKYTCARTPSDWRAVLNLIADVRRMFREQMESKDEA